MHYGNVPQNRERIFIVGFLDKEKTEAFEFPKQIPLTKNFREFISNEAEDKYYYKINGWIPMAKEIIAIEAKLKNWRRGIAQANRYKTFANKTYLAIPVEQEKNVNKDILKKYSSTFFFS